MLVLYEGPPGGWDKARFPEYNDGRRGWAYQSALLAGAEPSVVGFGRHGLTIHGNGGVPPAFWSLPYIYAGAPADTTRPPDAVVVNLGTNDRNAPVEMFGALYRAYLEAIRKLYPSARILCDIARHVLSGELLVEIGRGQQRENELLPSGPRARPCRPAISCRNRCRRKSRARSRRSCAPDVGRRPRSRKRRGRRTARPEHDHDGGDRLKRHARTERQNVGAAPVTDHADE